MFWRVGHGRVIKTLNTVVGRSCLRRWGQGFASSIHHMKQFAHNLYLPCCQCMETWSRVPFIKHLYAITWHKQQGAGWGWWVGGIIAYCRLAEVPRVWYHAASVNPFWRMGGWGAWYSCGWRSCIRPCGLGFAFGIQHIKLFAHNWYLPCCQCMETCFISPSHKIWYLA